MIPSQMKAAVLTAYGSPLTLTQVPVPVPASDEILVKLEYTGICHSDLHLRNGEWEFKPPLGRILGHEGVGTVVTLGTGVQGLNLGDRVVCPWVHSTCRNCEECNSGWETLCGRQEISGGTVDGTYAEYRVAKAAFVGRVPPSLPPAQAAPIACAGVTAYKALKVTGLHLPTQWVVLSGGAGGVGHVAIQYAKAMGLKVIGIDCGQSKKELMRSLGADATVDAKNENVVAAVRRITNGRGAHAAVIIVPLQQCIKDAVDYLGKGGKIVLVGLPPGDFSANIFNVVLNGITITGSIVGTRVDLQEALDIAGEGKVKCDVEVRSFSEVNNVLEDLRTEKIQGRVVLDISTA